LPARLLLIGDGPERQRIENQVRASDLCNDVLFLGKMTTPEDVVASCDLFALSSETESFGLAALEAMACAVPVVSTNTGGTPEVNIDGLSGLLNPVGDVEAMAGNALRILGDTASHERFRAGALEVARRFEVSVILPQYEDLYQRVLNG
jgi:glycosyltransferase involved in cell wall biosynthesis